MRRALQYGYAAVGWLLLYMAIGGAAGFAVVQSYQSEPSCVPFNSVFGNIESTCRDEWVNVFWLIAIGLPRLIIIVPALMTALLGVAITHGDSGMALNATPFLLASIPVLLVIWTGARWWWRRQRVVALTAVALILMEVVTLGSKA